MCKLCGYTWSDFDLLSFFFEINANLNCQENKPQKLWTENFESKGRNRVSGSKQQSKGNGVNGIFI